jgi:hypothetical protein
MFRCDRLCQKRTSTRSHSATSSPSPPQAFHGTSAVIRTLLQRHNRSSARLSNCKASSPAKRTRVSGQRERAASLVSGRAILGVFGHALLWGLLCALIAPLVTFAIVLSLQYFDQTCVHAGGFRRLCDGIGQRNHSLNRTRRNRRIYDRAGARDRTAGDPGHAVASLAFCLRSNLAGAQSGPHQARRVELPRCLETASPSMPDTVIAQ